MLTCARSQSGHLEEDLYGAMPSCCMQLEVPQWSFTSMITCPVRLSNNGAECGARRGEGAHVKSRCCWSRCCWNRCYYCCWSCCFLHYCSCCCRRQGHLRTGRRHPDHRRRRGPPARLRRQRTVRGQSQQVWRPSWCLRDLRTQARMVSGAS
jgi:hypothetical protein